MSSLSAKCVNRYFVLFLVFAIRIAFKMSVFIYILFEIKKLGFNRISYYRLIINLAELRHSQTAKTTGI